MRTILRLDIVPPASCLQGEQYCAASRIEFRCSFRWNFLDFLFGCMVVCFVCYTKVNRESGYSEPSRIGQEKGMPIRRFLFFLFFSVMHASARTAVRPEDEDYRVPRSHQRAERPAPRACCQTIGLSASGRRRKSKRFDSRWRPRAAFPSSYPLVHRICSQMAILGPARHRTQGSYHISLMVRSMAVVCAFSDGLLMLVWLLVAQDNIFQG
ncbi:hypothetical protein V8C37DRAFT_372869 [Trichoderma ceciliae]